MIHIVSGPPCAGKSTYVQEHKQEGDIVIDYDIIAEAVGDTRWSTSNVDLVKAMRRSAIDWCLPRADSITAWVIDTDPTQASLSRYHEADADIVTLDVPMDECIRRAIADERPQQTIYAIEAYFAHDTKEKTKMKTKSFDLIYESTEDIADGGEVLAYASTFDRIPDSYGDVVARGAFAKTLADWQASGNPIPLLFGHRTDDPRMNIGAVIEASEDERGLRIRARFDDENEIAQYTRKLVKEGRLTKLSFAYDTLDSAPVVLSDGTRANELRELKLYEVSLVPIPANELTEVIEAKGAEDFGMTNDEFRALRAGELSFDESDTEDASQDDGMEDTSDPDAKADMAEVKSPADDVDDALATITQLADRLDGIAEMIDDMVKRIAVMMPADEAPKQATGIDVKQADEADADSLDNEEAPHEGNSEVLEKADATLARMAKYIS